MLSVHAKALHEQPKHWVTYYSNMINLTNDWVVQENPILNVVLISQYAFEGWCQAFQPQMCGIYEYSFIYHVACGHQG